MSQAKAKYAADRWLATAREDLESARILADAARHAHACFLAQQAAEKAVKAMWYRLDADPWGHAVQRLLADFPARATLPEMARCEECGADLDKYYIPTRYPNGLPDLTPHTAYSARDSKQALEKSRFVIAQCEAWMKH